MFTWRGRWIGAAGWQTGALSCAPVGLAGAARNSSGGCREQHEVCCSWWSFPGLASFALSRMVRRRLGGCVRPSVACCGVVCLADEVQRHHVQGGELGVRWQELCARQRALYRPGRRRIFTCFRCVAMSAAGSFAASCGVGVAGATGRRRSCARFISGAFRRAQGHRIASVLCVILLACEPARLRRRTTTQKELEQHGRTGTSRSPNRPCTGCCRTPTRDGSRMRRAAAGRQRGRRQAHRRGSLRDGLAGRHSILNCHDGEIAAVHAATAVCSPSTRSTPPARLIIETRRAD